MPLRVGLVTAAHVHLPAYLDNFGSHARVEIVGIWDFDEARLAHCCERHKLKSFSTYEALLDAVDAVVVISENKLHVKHCAQAAAKGKHILCEKPLVTSEEEADHLSMAINESGVKFMVALPARFSPAFIRLKERLDAGEIGPVKAICATNHGTNPGGWFSIPELSGGGALVDHTAHVADLLWLLLKEEPTRVEASIGNNLHGGDADDCALLTLDYASGIFVTLDASWSRPKKYKTWGDLTMSVVGEKGVLELDMFAQQIQVFDMGDPGHSVANYGSDLYSLVVDAFVDYVMGDGPSPVSLEDGLRSSRIAMQAQAHARPNGHLPFPSIV